MPDPIDHAVAIFASRESAATLRATVLAAIAASEQASEQASVGDARCRPVIDVLINGNPALVEAAAQHAGARVLDTATAPLVRVWRVALADKAHTWNQYLETIWPKSRLAFFVDGYVRLWPDAINQLGSRVQASATALGGSGVPTAGRSAAAEARGMLSDGGLQGNFFCLTHDVLVEMRRVGFRLPLGLYRGDSLIGAALAYRLSPAMHAWDLKSTVMVEPKASWDLEVPQIWRPSDWRARWRRMDRQARGTLENLAVRDHLSMRRQPPQTLPRTAAELVLEWAERCPTRVQRARHENWRVARALKTLREPRDWKASEVAPELVIGTELGYSPDKAKRGDGSAS